MLNKLLFTLICITIVMSLCAKDEEFVLKGKSFMYIPYSKVKTHIDGKLSDEVWLRSHKFELKKMEDLGPIPYYKTKVRTYADKTNLYLSFQCFDSKMGKLTTGTFQKDDDKVFAEDYVMASFNISKNSKKPEIVSILVTANGVVRDVKGSSTEWDCKDFKFAVIKTSKSWDVEMSIPFASVFTKKDFRLQHGIEVNFYRVRPEKSWDELESSSWVPAGKQSPKESKEFGYLYMQAFGAKPGGVSKKIAVNHLYKGLPVLEVREVDKVFIIDGDIEEQIKEGVKPIEFKILDSRKKKPLINKTHVWILTTKKDLIICIRNYDISVDKTKASKKTRDKIDWGDDINEIFFSVGDHVTNDYYQIAVDAEGSLYDSYKSNVEWNGNDIKVATKKSEKYWDVEIKIPFENLDMNKVRKSWKKPWRFNISRVRPAHGDDAIEEESAWSPTNDTKSGIPAKFGYLFMDIVNAKLPKK